VRFLRGAAAQRGPVGIAVRVAPSSIADVDRPALARQRYAKANRRLSALAARPHTDFPALAHPAGASLPDLQDAAGYADPRTTRRSTGTPTQCRGV
jgi:hypothetical protein